jgi:uncharacterized membrane protein HdeD (DUF308 family)
MIRSFINHWWYFLLRGIIALSFGFLLIAWPLKTLLFVVTALGLLLLVEGTISTFLSIFNHKKIEKWGLVMAQGVFELIFGMVLFVLPKMSFEIMVFVVSVWLLVTGITQIALAIRIRKEIVGEWMMIGLGLINLIVSVCLLVNPKTTVLFFSVLIGGIYIIWGILLSAFAFELKGLKKDLSKLPY